MEKIMRGILVLMLAGELVCLPNFPSSFAAAESDIVPISLEKKEPGLEQTSAESFKCSIEKHDNGGFQLRPGVILRKGAIHIKQDEHDEKSIDIERPKNSTNDYQVMWKRKI